MPTRKTAVSTRRRPVTKSKGAKRARPRSSATADNGLSRFSMHASDAGSAPLVDAVRDASAKFRSMALTATPDAAAVDPETVARQYLEEALASKSVKAFAAPRSGDATSEFKSLGTETLPLTGTKTVKFRQTLNTIPVYGSLVTVELDGDNRLVGVNSSLGTPAGVSPIAKVSAADAAAAVKAAGDCVKNLVGVTPRLYYYFDQGASKWRLVFIFEDVRVRPEKGDVARRPVKRLMDYVVDAHSGKVVAERPRMATMASAQETAKDGLQVDRQVTVTVSGTKKLLKDSGRNVQTFDFNFRDPDRQESLLPGKAIGNPPAWAPAAVSAHANAEAVADFLRTVLQRNNIDNRGGAMNSSINCVDASEAEPGKVWRNAFWNGDQMVYGQVLFKGKLLSIAVDLDVVAHEMFHGVTDSTARLEYANQPGALNESYSDIFGVIVANFDTPDVGRWNWKLGERLDTGGKPFRDMADPTKRGQPAHMKDFQVLPDTERGDWGGVHVNSGIHNKAAYLMLTAKAPGGGTALTPREIAAIFYLALTQRLSRTSQFADSRSAAVNSALTLFRNQPVEQQRTKIGAVDDAFDAVGIPGKRVQVA